MGGNSSRRRVSAVIRAYNEGQHIGRLLTGLEQQTRKPDEIIVVDSGSTDDTVAIAEAAEREQCRQVLPAWMVATDV